MLRTKSPKAQSKPTPTPMRSKNKQHRSHSIKQPKTFHKRTLTTTTKPSRTVFSPAPQPQCLNCSANTFHSIPTLQNTSPLATTSPITQTKRTMAMHVDPLGRQVRHSTSEYIPRSTMVAARSSNRPLRVLVAGYMSFFAQHLVGKLEQHGFEVVPVSQEGTHPTAITAVHSTAYYQAHGLDDADFIINCAGLNLFGSKFETAAAKAVKLQTNALWAKLIRNAKSKPYAYITMSSTAIYPGNTDQIFLDSWQCPGLSSYTFNDAERHQFDKEHKITPLMAMYRDAEAASRVFIPELDARTPEQIEEYKKFHSKYWHEDKKSGVHDGRHENTLAQDNSARLNLLTNAQVRVIPMRLGMLACSEMQEVRDFRNFVENGKWGRIPGHENGIVPWMWVDDAVEATIAAMMSPHINGAVNCVTPPTTTSGELMDFIAKINKAPTHPMALHQLEAMYGGERAKLFYEKRLVVPQKLKKIGFVPSVLTLDQALQTGRSDFEFQINEAGGIEKLPRFAYHERR